MSDSQPEMSEKLNKTTPTLYDMPAAVLDNVLSNLNYKTHLALRTVCKSLRDLVDKRPPASKSISLHIHAAAGGYKTFKASLSFDDRCVLKDGSVEQAMQGLKGAVNHIRTRLNEFKIRVHTNSYSEWEKKLEMEARKPCFAQIKDVLSTMPRGTLDVEKLVMVLKSQDEILSILPYMTPGVLEFFHVVYLRILPEGLCTHRLATRQLIKLEQWKRAKTMNLVRFVVQFPIQHIAHFRESNIQMTSISMKQVQVLRDAVLRKPDFVSSTLFSTKTIDTASIDEHLGLPGPQSPEPPELYRRYPVPDSDDHVLEISILPESVYMVRNLKTDLLY